MKAGGREQIAAQLGITAAHATLSHALALCQSEDRTMHKQVSETSSTTSASVRSAQIATREDRVCVLNILGGESSEVTPVGHAYSGGNVVFGTSPGRRGQVLETPVGDIPVYNNVREGLEPGTASTAAWSTCRPRPHATAWPS